jgi:CPA1 family monovalent cation:H+ antiporter
MRLAIFSTASKEGKVNFAQIITISTILLLVATVFALLSRRFRVTYVTGLVLAGLAITELLPRRIGLDPSLVLNLFLPILIFEAAINTDISRLRSTFKPIALLAGPRSVISAAIIALLLKFGLGLTWIPALLVGVVLANTDTVSMLAVFKDISVPCYSWTGCRNIGLSRKVSASTQVTLAFGNVLVLESIPLFFC